LRQNTGIGKPSMKIIGNLAEFRSGFLFSENQPLLKLLQWSTVGNHVNIIFDGWSTYTDLNLGTPRHEARQLLYTFLKHVIRSIGEILVTKINTFSTDKCH
jgi:hypothetical protein